MVSNETGVAGVRMQDRSNHLGRDHGRLFVLLLRARRSDFHLQTLPPLMDTLNRPAPLPRGTMRRMANTRDHARGRNYPSPGQDGLYLIRPIETRK